MGPHMIIVNAFHRDLSNNWGLDSLVDRGSVEVFLAVLLPSGFSKAYLHKLYVTNNRALRDAALSIMSPIGLVHI